jgi:hypothetical protein
MGLYVKICHSVFLSWPGSDNLTGCRYPLSTCAKIRTRYNRFDKFGAVNFYQHRVNRG